jgi:hypothetical protein
VTSTSPALPSFSRSGDERRRPGSRWFAGLLLLLGFAFTASVLVGTDQHISAARSAAPATSTETASPESPINVGPADSQEVSAAVRAWTWETSGPSRAPAREHDVEELWLPR